MGALMPAMAETLTVYEGENTSSYVPIHGLYAENFLKCEYVIPATDLATMQGAVISSLQWTVSTPASGSWGDANFQVFVKEVDAATISSFSGLDGATIVYEGAIDGTQSTITIEFAEPYQYQGGNLLIGVYNTVKGSWKSIYFKGTTVEGASVQGYHGTSLDDVTATQRNFIPMTTFTYDPNAGPVYKRPTNLAASNITTNGATITWTPGSTETAWNVEYKKAADENWTAAGVANTNSFDLEDLSNGTVYDVRVQGDYGEGNLSAWATTSFVTVMCDDADKGEIEYSFTDTYGDGWNGNKIQIVCQENGQVIETLTIETGGKDEPIVGTVPLCYGFTYDIKWISGNFGTECGFIITGPEGVIIEHEPGTAPTAGVLTSFFMQKVSCPRPKDLAASNITPTGATLTWTAGDAEQDLWEVVYAAGEVAADAIEMTPVQANEATLALTGLTPSTAYSAYVRGVCGEQDKSSWSAVCNFTTLAADAMPTNLTVNEEAITATSAEVSWDGYQQSYNLRYRPAAVINGFTEDFESLTTHAASILPEGWTMIDADGDGYNWMSWNPVAGGNDSNLDNAGNPTTLDNACVTSASYVSGALTPDNWLISPQVNLGGTLSLWARGQDPSYAEEHFAVYVSVAGNTNTADFLENEVIPETIATAVYTEYTADLSAFDGKVGYIAIRHFNITDMFRLNIDNVSIVKEGEDIPAGEWVTVENVTSPYTITGLKPKTNYEVQVQGVFESRGVTEWTNSAFFTTLENTKYYVCGGFNDWNQEEALEITEEGATFDAEFDAADEFCLDFKLITAGENGWIWFGGEDANDVGYFDVTEGMLTDGTEITLDDDGSNFRLPAPGNYTITLVNEAKAPVEGVKMVVKFNKPISTGINDVYGKPVKSVKYVNIAGIESDKPFDGVNIVVTTFTDGTKATSKVIK